MTDTPKGVPGGEHSAATGGGRLDDRYEIGGLLGRGGMADVRIGRDLRLGRTVAVKRLRSDLASDPTFLARFRREAQSSAALNHPSIVAVYDTGDAEAPDGSIVPYIVMEYVEGQTLRDVLHDGRKVLPQRALELTAEILEALDYSHRAGIVHRDIKPGNVMLTPAGQVKVMDFGIARAIADSSSAMTQTAAVVGTAQYLSPEQARGEQVDARSDLYSTGCLLFELLTGRPPFVGDSPVSVAYQHVREEPVAPSSLNPDVTPAMDAIVARALAKRPEDRYQSAAEMRADIERVLAGQQVTMPVAAAYPVDPATTQAATYAMPVAAPLLPAADVEPDGEDEARRRRRWPWVLLTLLVLLALAGVGLALSGVLGGGEPPAAATVTVPNVVGQGQSAAENRLKSVRLTVGEVTRDFSNDHDKGQVVSTDPQADTQLNESDPVDLVVSKGPEQVQVPQVVGSSLSAAKSALRGQNLDVEVTKQASDQPANQVLSTNPVAYTSVDVNSTVTVTVSEGPTQVPDVVGRTEQKATRMLQDAGFEVDSVPDPTATDDAGTVVRQSPAAGNTLSSGDTVTIVVSAATPETPTPTEPTPTEPTPTPTPDGGGPGNGGGLGGGGR